MHVRNTKKIKKKLQNSKFIILRFLFSQIIDHSLFFPDRQNLQETTNYSVITVFDLLAQSLSVYSQFLLVREGKLAELNDVIRELY